MSFKLCCEFSNCCGGMWVGVNDVVCTRIWNTIAESRNICLLLQAGVGKALNLKGQGVLACQCPYLLVPEVWLLCYWIRLKIFALTLLEKKKKLNVNIAKAASMIVGSLVMSHCWLLFSACFIAYPSVSEPRLGLMPCWIWRKHFSMQD